MDNTLSIDEPFMVAGLDSVRGMLIGRNLATHSFFSGDINPGTLVFDYPTKRALASHLAQMTSEDGDTSGPEETTALNFADSTNYLAAVSCIGVGVRAPVA
jgi:hypothetical protein